MRVYVTSTPEELEPYQLAACDVVAEFGHEALLRDPTFGRGLKPVAACARQIRGADVVLAIVGHRRGRVPSPGFGGDGLRPWAWWETRAGFEHGLPVGALMTADGWRPELREEEPKARALMSDFRGELARLAVYFDQTSDFDHAPGANYREQVRQQLVRLAEASESSESALQLELRTWPPPELPARPYPVLLPYSHPDLLAGRDREIAEIKRLLARPVPILGLYAPSGAGKSSFLHAGLVQGLRAEGKPVAFDRHPSEPGLARRLLGDLLLGDGSRLGHGGPKTLIDRLLGVRRLAGRSAVLVLDQFEDLFRRDDSAKEARAVLGCWLAASVQRQPGLAEPPCRWILAYRQEFHGAVFEWLGDVLSEARFDSEMTDSLPHDLSGPDRFQPWPLLPLGTPEPGTVHRAATAAAQAFQEAIEKPLCLETAAGLPIYRWRFAGDGAARLGRAFGEVRARRPRAPLVPELQVVLAHLLEQARADQTEMDGSLALIEVPEKPGELIERALEEHLKRSLDVAFPRGIAAQAKLRRTRALLALRELASDHGRRDGGQPAATLARAIGHGGREILERLSTPQTRLVLLEETDDGPVYVLSHDRMAEVIVRMVEGEGADSGLGIDAELLGLRRFVALQRELFTTGEVEQSTVVPEAQFRAIAQHVDTLLWDVEGQRWWQACQGRRRLDRRRRTVQFAVVAMVLVLSAVLAGVWTDRYFERQAMLEAVAEGEPEAAFAALAALTSTAEVAASEVLDKMQRREEPFDVLEHGLGGVDEARGQSVVRIVEFLWPMISEDREDPVRIASTVWALDFFAIPDASVRERALALRDRILEPLRLSRPPPPPPAVDDWRWADIPAGTFWMGAGPGDHRDDPNMRDEFPRHQVTLSAFRMMVHEVTNAEFRRLWPEHGRALSDYPGADDQPVSSVSWYQAYTYAAWLGGRLPTESEAEYAVRAGCQFAFCRHDGTEATRDEVAWWIGNSADPTTGEPSVQPVMQLEPNPWGLWDVYGNVWEWCASWYGAYSEDSTENPSGPTDSRNFSRVGVATVLNYRTYRGGSVYPPHEWVWATGRGAKAPNVARPGLGLRVVIADSASR